MDLPVSSSFRSACLDGSILETRCWTLGNFRLADVGEKWSLPKKVSEKT